MIGDDDVVVGCWRVVDLEEPHPASLLHTCEWAGCGEAIWVHPNSVAIAVAEHGRLICIDHLDDVPDVKIAVHPLQGNEIRETLRGLGLLDDH